MCSCTLFYANEAAPLRIPALGCVMRRRGGILKVLQVHHFLLRRQKDNNCRLKQTFDIKFDIAVHWECIFPNLYYLRPPVALKCVCMRRRKLGLIILF